MENSTPAKSNGLAIVDNQIIRSAGINELISRQPSFLVRWGVLIISSIIGTLLLASFMISYPDVIEGKAYLNSINAPKEVVSRSSGKLLKLFVSEYQDVKEGDILGVIESSASFENVLRLSVLLDSIRILAIEHRTTEIQSFVADRINNLGELQQSYQTFIQALQNYNSYSKFGFYIRKRKMLVDDIGYLERINHELKTQRKYLGEDLSLSDSTYLASQKLQQQLVLSSLDLRNERSKLIAKQMTLPEVNLEIISNESKQHDKRKEMAELDNQIALQDVVFFQYLSTIQSQVAEWQMKYLLKSPMAGKVAFTKFIQPNQEIKTGQLICYINSNDPVYYAEVLISQHNFGKVKKGQQVVLKFLAYPWQEYGTVHGKLEFISAMPTDSGYFARVILDDGITTNMNKNILYQTGLVANAEIITKQRKLIDRITSTFRKNVSDR